MVGPVKHLMFGGICLCWLAVAASGAFADDNRSGSEAHKPPSGEALQYELPRSLTGSIYALGTTQLLYQFKRTASRSGDTLKVDRQFTYPDGRPAARERVLYHGDALVEFDLQELQLGASGSATIRRAPDDPAQGTIEFKYTGHPGARQKVGTERLRPNTLMADMVGPFLKAHWAALESGEKVKCRYLVIPRCETVGFTFVKDRDSTWRGTPAVLVRMGASSPFIAALVEPLVFTLQKAPPHRVLQYVGRTTPKIRVRDQWQDLDALTVFDWNRETR
jgi:hypothetical protein